HEAERRGRAAGIVIVARRNGASTDAGVGQRGRAESIDGCATIADFGFEAEATEVITHHGVNVITIVMVDAGDASARAGDIIIDVFDDHPAAFDAAMARRGAPAVAETLVALDRRRREVTTEAQTAQARRNEASKAIGAAKAQKDEATAAAPSPTLSVTRGSISFWTNSSIRSRSASLRAK
ncbi:hypothetical protein LTR94_031412, partial [Friedmanniomyces endolithicus]